MNEQTPQSRGGTIWWILSVVFFLLGIFNGFFFFLFMATLIIGRWLRAKNAARPANTSPQNSTSYPYQQPMPQQPQPRYDSRTGVLLPQTPVYSNSTAMSATTPYLATTARQGSYNPTTDNHLCDDNEHAPEAKKSYANTMYELESGYTPYSKPATAGYVSQPAVQLSVDDKRRKVEEFKDLLDAGLIEKEEYNQFMRDLQ